MGDNKQPGALAEIFERGKLVWRLMQDQRVPTWIRIGIPAIVFLYFISPVDIIPDFILGLGQLDDLGVILLGMSLFIRLAPSNVVEEHRRALGIDPSAPLFLSGALLLRCSRCFLCHSLGPLLK